jgi:mevalonate pyrophosphate decarboxylase
VRLWGRFTPSYSTHLNLPNNHSIIILTVTRSRKITILTIKPLDHATKGVTDMIINSKSKMRKIIQKIKNRKETGKTLTLKESNPHSNVSTLIGFLLTKTLAIPITKGTKTEINK